MSKKSLFFITFPILIFVLLSTGTPAFCREQEKVNVLALLPLSGPAAPHGQYLLHGIEMHLEDMPHSDLELSIQDTGSDPKTAMAILTREISTNRPEVIISSHSRVSKPVLARAREEGIFTVIVLSTSQDLVKGYENVQRISPPTTDNVKPIALLAKEKFSKVSILYSNEEFGITNKEVFSSLYSGKE